MFQLYCYVYLNFNMQKDIYLLSWSSGIVGRQERQS